MIESYCLPLPEAHPIAGIIVVGRRQAHHLPRRPAEGEIENLPCQRAAHALRSIEGDGLGDVLRQGQGDATGIRTDRKSTRLNSSHSQISYAVFCLKKTK